MTNKGGANGSFFGNHIYENLLARRSHLQYELSQVVDFSFVRNICRDFYVDWGRYAWDPVLMFKMVFLQFLYDLSDREVKEQITFNMAFKWFLGPSAEEFPPDHTTLCRFRQRLGADGFRTFFNAVVEQARSQGFVSDRLHILDV
ncbi:transposase [Desulfobacca acetoxidans]|uniref:Transposase, IS4 family protein n=1 Tax=Desulfobacca acetoxidans (strain ATCC 700848 / DSM 11109 / ASRB2) TaxID=880072 RepID=F2ND40_DESAR|nr:transposase [Desulfobacca acetoxidans]AEB09764.1 transposase, IS4 family protein [Desulfobacca acetoxidans DSM 11109]